MEDLVQELINDGKGDLGRLEHILATVKAGRELYSSDKDYLEKLLIQTGKKSQQSIENSETVESKEIHHSKDLTSEQPPDIELLRQEIHKLQDRNHVIEEQFRNQGNHKPRSQVRAFGTGTGGIILFLFGLGMIFLLHHYLSNLQDYARSMYYGGDPMVAAITYFLIIPGILLIMGGTSIYYGIKIISNN